MQKSKYEKRYEANLRGHSQQQKYEEDVQQFSVALNSDIKTGMVEKRGCTDLICTIAFVAFLIMMINFSVYGYRVGNVRKLMAPIDRHDHFCGIG